MSSVRIFSGPPQFTLAQLSAGLHLSTMWGFDAVREYTIKEIDQRFNETLDGYDPFDRLDLADRANVPKWRRPAFRVICERSGFLKLEEAQRLGLKRTVAICAVREQCRPAPGVRCGSCYNCSYGYACQTPGQNLEAVMELQKEALELV